MSKREGNRHLLLILLIQRLMDLQLYYNKEIKRMREARVLALEDGANE
jgi:hypothetical protein